MFLHIDYKGKLLFKIRILFYLFLFYLLCNKNLYIDSLLLHTYATDILKLSFEHKASVRDDCQIYT